VADSEFDTDTAVSRLAEGSYTTTITPRWNIGAAPNGGYLLAILLRALGDALPHPDVLTVTAHYVRPPAPGRAAVEVERIHSGRSLSSASARLLQGAPGSDLEGGECLRALATFTDLDREADGRPSYVDGGPPGLPPPDECLRGDGRMPGGGSAAIGERFDLRLHPGTVGWARGGPTGRPEVGGWIRLADGREPDLPLMAVVVDALPPTVFDLGVAGWVPTIELTLHLRARPAPGWLRCWIRSRFLTGGYVEEDAEVWDADGRLVAMSRQLARVPRMRSERRREWR
jgi:acyl-coenzyme A thioesterase PaaI-like protein